MKLQVGITYGAFQNSIATLCNSLSQSGIESDTIYLSTRNLKRFLQELDIIIFSGGADINPAIYGEANTSSFINPERDREEITIFSLARESKIPVLGICRGHQLINALLGGKLIQDLIHPGHHILENSSGVFQNFENVNSLHHQGVLLPGKNLTVTSEYKGVIESTEGDNILSVQCHPEILEQEKRKAFWLYTLTHFNLI